MEEQYSEYKEDGEDTIRARRRERIERMKREKARRLYTQQLVRKYAPFVAGAAVLFVCIFAGVKLVSAATDGKNPTDENTSIESSQNSADLTENNNLGPDQQTQGVLTADGTQEVQVPEGVAGSSDAPAAAAPFSAQTTAATKTIGGEVVSTHAIMIEEKTGNILGQLDAMSRISPASMTKILTVLVAAEHVTDLDDTFTITIDITDYSYVNDCSNVGFEVGETVTVRDLFYGTILPSGADAAVGLATYVAGSQEAFVELMNDKLEELGLSDTAHFTNCVGLYDKEHYCTTYDMAMILKAAMDNPLCREVLSAHVYTTSPTEQHPEGLTISNWFLRRIEDKDCGGTVLGGKTGYVVQSGNCSASYALDEEGNGYICVTANSSSSWRCIYDHVAIYQEFLP